jgi:hypothetical protein
LVSVSSQWGAVQKTDMEYELASMRKQMGELWELAATSQSTKIQKRITDLTLEIQNKDSLMADVIGRQGNSIDNVDLFAEEELARIQSMQKTRKKDLFPDILPEDSSKGSTENLADDGEDDEDEEDGEEYDDVPQPLTISIPRSGSSSDVKRRGPTSAPVQENVVCQYLIPAS